MPDITNLSIGPRRRSQGATPPAAADPALTRATAQARLAELAEEARSILASFPDLHGSAEPFSSAAPKQRENGRARKTAAPARRKTAAARKKSRR